MRRQQAFTLTAPGGSSFLFSSSTAQANGTLAWIEETDGLDEQDIGAESAPNGVGPGDIPKKSKLGPRVISCSGFIFPIDSLSDADVKETADNIKAVLRRCVNAYGILSWTDDDSGLTYQCSVRVIDEYRPKEGPGPFTVAFNFTLKNHSGQIVDGGDADSVSINPNTDEVVTNAGDCETYPILRLYGPYANGVAQIKNGSRKIHLAGINLQALSFIELDTLAKTIRLNGPSGRRMDGLQRVASTYWWHLSEDDNTIELVSSGHSGAAHLEVIWRNGRTS